MDYRNVARISLEMDVLPPTPAFEPGIRRAPRRESDMNPAQERLALMNALRYIPPEWHERLAGEFLRELRERGRIYAIDLGRRVT